MVPSILYSTYNVITLFAIPLIGPGPYRLLINLKVLTSAIFLQSCGMKKLSYLQWMSLILLFFACFIERFDSIDLTGLGMQAIGLVVVQCICSSLAGVSNQFLFKIEQNTSEDKLRLTWMRNIMLYSWTSLFNLLLLLYYSWAPTTSDADVPVTSLWDEFASLANISVFPIILSNTCVGFATSLLLSFYDVILKEYGNFLELVLTVVFSWVFFDLPLKINLVIAVLIAGYSLISYTKEDDRLSKEERRKEPVPVSAADLEKGDKKQEIELHQRKQ